MRMKILEISMYIMGNIYITTYYIMLYYIIIFLSCRSNATRNLCNILKDTFERSAEKMNLCKCRCHIAYHNVLIHCQLLENNNVFFILPEIVEAEREETHDLFIQNSENIQVTL